MHRAADEGFKIAKHLDAGKALATGRNLEALKSLAALGADVTIPLRDDEAALEERVGRAFSQGVDVVLDYLWGKSAERLIIAGAKRARRPCRCALCRSVRLVARI